jgi:hypothetical protein
LRSGPRFSRPFPVLEKPYRRANLSHVQFASGEFLSRILNRRVPSDFTLFVNLFHLTVTSFSWYKNAMNSSDYQKAIEAAQTETRSLLEQRTAIDIRLTQLQKTIENLSTLLGETPEYEIDPAAAGMLGIPISDAGISDAIRQLLAKSGAPLSPVEIRDRLDKEGFDINGYASGLTVIHNTLKRLERQREIGIVRSPNGIRAYPLPHNFVPMNTPAESYRKRGTDREPNSAYTSGMRGNEKPPKK